MSSLEAIRLAFVQKIHLILLPSASPTIQLFASFAVNTPDYFFEHTLAKASS